MVEKEQEGNGNCKIQQDKLLRLIYYAVSKKDNAILFKTYQP